MKMFIGSDHAGFELKNDLVSYLEEHGLDVTDMGPAEYNKEDDYPDLISLVAEEVSKDPDNVMGIVIGKSGQGEALVANKFKGVRAGVYYGGNKEIPKLLREHNNANILSLGAGFLTQSEAEEAVDLFIETQFSNDERHKRRLEKLHIIDQSK